MTDKEQTRTQSRHSRRAQPPQRRWPWILLAVLAVVVAIPVGMFAYAYSQYKVPEPEELTNKQITTIFASDSSTQLARIVPPEGNRQHVTLEQIPDYAENATLAAEDREFWTNSGFSITGFSRAVLGQITGNDSAGGGSTITQQYVKNTLVGDERSYVRKARELVYSIKMTNEWSKEEILNAYLNTVYYGRNAYGIQAASSAYFDKNVEDLTPEESALLAAVIQRPSALDPWTNQAETEPRWNYVLDGLVEMGDLSEQERAGMVFPETRNPAEYSAYTEATGANGHIKHQVIKELGELGISEEDVETQGLNVTTTIDMTVQNAQVDAVDTALAPLQEDARAGAVVIEPKTGAVRGYFGGHDANGWDYANAPLQTGSIFKIMAVAAAAQQGISLDTVYSSEPFQLPGGITVTNHDGTGCGACSIKEALKNSYNTSFMRVQDDLTNKMDDTQAMAYSLGVERSLPTIPQTLTENGNPPYEGIVLGQYQSRPIDMATAMATLANGGVWNKTHFVQKVETNSGEVLYEHPNDGQERRVSQQVAYNTLDAMKPIAAWSNGALAGGRESVAKTGTAQLGDTGLNKDTWMIGGTPQLVSAVWVGTADNTSAIFNAWGGNMFGSGAATQIWKQTLDTSLANAEWESFPTGGAIRYGSGTAGSAGTWYDPSWNNTQTWDSGSGEEGGEDAPEGDNAGEGDGNGGEDRPAPAPEPDPEPAPQPGGGGGGGAPNLEDIINDQIDNLFN